MFSVVYAIPCAGQREFRFKSAADMADHVRANRPGLFAGCPEVDGAYEDKMEELRSRSYHIPEKR